MSLSAEQRSTFYSFPSSGEVDQNIEVSQQAHVIMCKDRQQDEEVYTFCAGEDIRLGFSALKAGSLLRVECVTEAKATENSTNTVKPVGTPLFVSFPTGSSELSMNVPMSFSVSKEHCLIQAKQYDHEWVGRFAIPTSIDWPTNACLRLKISSVPVGNRAQWQEIASFPIRVSKNFPFPLEHHRQEESEGRFLEITAMSIQPNDSGREIALTVVSNLRDPFFSAKIMNLDTGHTLGEVQQIFHPSNDPLNSKEHTYRLSVPFEEIEYGFMHLTVLAQNPIWGAEVGWGKAINIQPPEELERGVPLPTPLLVRELA